MATSTTTTTGPLDPSQDGHPLPDASTEARAPWYTVGGARRILRRHGVVGAARLVVAKPRAHLDQRGTWVWYALDLGAERPRPALADGHRLVRVRTDDELRLYEQLPPDPETQDPRGSDVGERLEAGGVPWVVLAGARPAFTCWTFLRRTPVGALPSGWLELPPGVACLEDSVTSADFRGQGIAPRAWAALSDALHADGFHTLVTQVYEQNAASRRAVTKAGFREVAHMERRTVGPRVKLAVRQADGQAGRMLAERLDGRGRWAF